jgi:hypothetical protein
MQEAKTPPPAPGGFFIFQIFLGPPAEVRVSTFALLQSLSESIVFRERVELGRFSTRSSGLSVLDRRVARSDA